MDPLVLYSTNTWLSYMIAEQYYGSKHYVWCTPYFDARKHSDITAVVPPTSSPCEIYRSLHEEITRRDRHSSKVNENKVGILRGASIKRKEGVIGEHQEGEIGQIVEAAESHDFRPLLFIIPYAPVADLLRRIPVPKRAHPLSEEYLIEALPRSLFDVIEFPI